MDWRRAQALLGISVGFHNQKPSTEAINEIVCSKNNKILQKLFFNFELAAGKFIFIFSKNFILLARIHYPEQIDINFPR